MRRDAVTCSQVCRQARHRFNRTIGADTSRPPAASPTTGRRLAYADPPYPGLSRRYYADHPDYAGEVDHQALADQLAGYDGWALSTSAAALPAVLEFCPDGVRVAAWHRGAFPHGAPAGPLSAWEPVIYSPPARRRLTLAAAERVVPVGDRGVASSCDRTVARIRWRAVVAVGDRAVVRGRRRAVARRRVRAVAAVGDWSSSEAGPLTDSLIFTARPRLTDPHRVIGAKPAVFIRWVFGLLDARPGDSLDDLFPGSGGISRAWRTYTAAAG